MFAFAIWIVWQVPKAFELLLTAFILFVFVGLWIHSTERELEAEKRKK